MASDEKYIIDLCDRILGETAKRQHRFDYQNKERRMASLRKRKCQGREHQGHDQAHAGRRIE